MDHDTVDSFLCKVDLWFSLKARKIDDNYFYKDYGYYISPERLFEASVNGTVFRKGKIVSVIDDSIGVTYG